jgi:26S proteasome regulatory subunit N11
MNLNNLQSLLGGVGKGGDSKK